MKKVWTNGCFDVVHIGHIKLFEYARSLGDSLIVGIDSDKRVKTLKGESRPINCQQERKKFLESIKYIDHVVVFENENHLSDLIFSQQIHTIVVGDDYKDKKVVGSENAKQVIFFPKIINKSSSKIISELL